MNLLAQRRRDPRARDPKLRADVVAMYRNEHKPTEIARALCLPLGTVRNWINLRRDP